MNTKKKALIVSALLVVVGGYYIYNNMKKNQPDVVLEMTEDTIDSEKVLAVGSTGEEVKRLQTALKGGLVVDGNFGALTEKRTAWKKPFAA